MTIQISLTEYASAIHEIKKCDDASIIATKIHVEPLLDELSGFFVITNINELSQEVVAKLRMLNFPFWDMRTYGLVIGGRI